MVSHQPGHVVPNSITSFLPSSIDLRIYVYQVKHGQPCRPGLGRLLGVVGPPSSAPSQKIHHIGRSQASTTRPTPGRRAMSMCIIVLADRRSRRSDRGVLEKTKTEKVGSKPHCLGESHGITYIIMHPPIAFNPDMPVGQAGRSGL